MQRILQWFNKNDYNRKRKEKREKGEKEERGGKGRSLEWIPAMTSPHDVFNDISV